MPQEYQGLPEDLLGFAPANASGRVKKAENLVHRWVTGRKGIDPDSPLLPGGRQLTWPELTELNAMMGEAYGFNSLVDNLGKRYGGPTEKGPFHWVVNPEQGENRAYARVAVGRETLLQTEDPALFALSQTSFQFRPERKALAEGGRYSAMYPLSGSRPTWDNIHRLMKQRHNYLSEEGTRVIFDIESASLTAEHGIRQLSYRVMKDGETVNKTLNFENSVMGLGHYGKPLKEALGLEGQQLLPQEHVAESLTEFFEHAGSARYLIGQNAMFDVGMLQQVKKEDIYQRGGKLLEGLGNGDVNEFMGTLNPRDKAAVRLHRAANSFFENAYSDNFVDTAAHARILMGQVGTQRLEVAPEILARKAGSLFSIENLVLQSSLVQDIANQGLADRGEIRQMLGGGGLHGADVDTWFTDMLSRLQKQGYANEGVLKPEALTQKVLDDIWQGSGQATPQIKEMRGRISSARALTPFTNISEEAVTGLHRAGLIDQEFLDEVKGHKRGITGLESMMLHSRNLALTSPLAAGFSPESEAVRDVAARKLISNSGVFRRFVQENGLMDDEGHLNRFGRYPDPAVAKVIQEKMEEAGYHAPGMSPIERMVAMTLGEAQAGESEIGNARKLLSETTPVAFWKSSTLAAFPKKAPPKTVAIPLDYLREMEAKKVIGGTKIADALGGGGVQWLGMSPFQYRTWWGKQVEDVGLTMKGVISADEATRGEQVKGIVDWLRENKGVEEGTLGRIEEGLKATGHTTGIQVATLTKAKGSQGATKVFNLLKDLGYDVDREGKGWRLPLLFSRAGEIVTGGAYSGGGEAIARGADESKVLGTLAPMHETVESFERKLIPDTRFMVEMNAGFKPIVGKAKSLAEAIPKLYTDVISKHLRPRTAVIAGAVALTGYYLHNRRHNQLEDALSQEPYEDSDFYGRYKRQLGEPDVRPSMALSSPDRDPLATAHIPGYLDRNKSSHYKMGPQKHAHLFGG